MGQTDKHVEIYFDVSDITTRGEVHEPITAPPPISKIATRESCFLPCTVVSCRSAYTLARTSIFAMKRAVGGSCLFKLFRYP